MTETTIPTWDDYFLNMLDMVKSRSPDAQTKVACIITKDNKILGCGYNGFPSGMDGLPNTRPLKYKWCIHGEINCICNCNSKEKDTTSYITHLPCNVCVKALWQFGVRRIVIPPNKKVFTYTDDDYEVLKGLIENGLRLVINGKSFYNHPLEVFKHELQNE